MLARRDRPASRAYVERTRAHAFACARAKDFPTAASRVFFSCPLKSDNWIRRVHARREPTAKGPYCGARSRGNAGRRRLIGGPRWASGLSDDVEFANVPLFELCRNRFKSRRASFRVCPGTLRNGRARFVPPAEWLQARIRLAVAVYFASGGRIDREATGRETVPPAHEGVIAAPRVASGTKSRGPASQHVARIKGGAQGSDMVPPALKLISEGAASSGTGSNGAASQHAPRDRLGSAGTANRAASRSRVFPALGLRAAREPTAQLPKRSIGCACGAQGRDMVPPADTLNFQGRAASGTRTHGPASQRYPSIVREALGRETVPLAQKTVSDGRLGAAQDRTAQLPQRVLGIALRSAGKRNRAAPCEGSFPAGVSERHENARPAFPRVCAGLIAGVSGRRLRPSCSRARMGHVEPMEPPNDASPTLQSPDPRPARCRRHHPAA
jgi:hypothetical protein